MKDFCMTLGKYESLETLVIFWRLQYFDKKLEGWWMDAFKKMPKVKVTIITEFDEISNQDKTAKFTKDFLKAKNISIVHKEKWTNITDDLYVIGGEMDKWMEKMDLCDDSKWC